MFEEIKIVKSTMECSWLQAIKIWWQLHTNPIILAEEEEENED